jgi:hypothetical protein
VNPEKTKYVLMSRYKKAGQDYGVMIVIRSAAKLRYLGTTLTHQTACMKALKIG